MLLYSNHQIFHLLSAIFILYKYNFALDKSCMWHKGACLLAWQISNRLYARLFIFVFCYFFWKWFWKFDRFQMHLINAYKKKLLWKYFVSKLFTWLFVFRSVFTKVTTKTIVVVVRCCELDVGSQTKKRENEREKEYSVLLGFSFKNCMLSCNEFNFFVWKKMRCYGKDVCPFVVVCSTIIFIVQ